MAISTLQRDAFIASRSFNEQVGSQLLTEALYRHDNTPNLSDGNRGILANVIRGPTSYGFAQTIVADAGWVVTYDAYAADPEGQNGAILAGIQKYFDLLTGYQPEANMAPLAEPETEPIPP